MTGMDDWNLSFTDTDFDVIAELTHRYSGIDLGHKKHDMVYARLSKRVRELGLSSFRDYCRLLTSPAGDREIWTAVNAITTNLTRFFREDHHFRHLATVMLPQRIAEESRRRHGATSKRLRIWSAGCSSGEEAYSIAMTVANGIDPTAGWDSKILATDIDSEILERASLGLYSATDIDRIPPNFRRAFVDDLPDGRFRIAEGIRRLISFKRLNLMGPWPMKGPFDAIFCRNVAIYFSKSDQIRLFDRLAQLLTPNGYLYIGHSENLFGVAAQFQLVERTIYRRTK